MYIFITNVNKFLNIYFLHKIYLALISAEFRKISEKNYRVSQKIRVTRKNIFRKNYKFTKEIYDVDLHLSLRRFRLTFKIDIYICYYIFS